MTSMLRTIKAHINLRILLRLWRRRGLLYMPLLGIISALWICAAVMGLNSVRQAALPILALIAAGFTARYLAWVYFGHLHHALLTRRMRRWVGQLRSGRPRSLLLFSGMTGGLAGGILSGPLIGHAYIGSVDIGELGQGCEFGILYCGRFYWVLFCTSFAGAVLGSCIGLFLHRACLKQVMQYSAEQIANLRSRLERFLSCITGGIVAALIAGPVIGIGSAALGGPRIRVADIFLETLYTVIIVNVLIIGAF